MARRNLMVHVEQVIHSSQQRNSDDDDKFDWSTRLSALVSNFGADVTSEANDLSA